MTRMGRWGVTALALVALAACSAAPSLEPSPSGASSSAGPVGQLPAGCAPIDLRGPDGERVDLTGTWAGTGAAALVIETETAHLTQIGDCVRGVVVGEDSVDGSRSIANLVGQLRPDFFMDTEVVFVLQEGVFPYGEYSTMVVAIEWDDDGELRLRELRDAGAAAGRCVTATLQCPEPFVWYRVEP
jgi:hypothetical protein